ncbi:CHAD domain-containing protein, partial [Streptomyces sp. S3(2020)]|uniref:CHAD domain-containing protein n=1 Tax=Streptomyces sp. S3(2020) TaxID=2732044 RepID=UPI001487936D|nr:CHAD domain-containing protein [Streptomyces sp. S3(2020)]
MAQQHLEPTEPVSAHVGPVTGDALAGYLRAQATEFLRALRLHRESGAAAGHGSEPPVDAARALRRSARRISGSLHTFRPLLEADWSERMRPELAWVSGTLASEHACEARLERLLLALHRLSGATVLPGQGTGAGGARDATGTAAGSRAAGAAADPKRPASGGTAPDPKRAAPGGPGPAPHTTAAPDRGNLTVGAAKAGALLDRQLTLARTRAHSTALQALGSSRFHAVADNIAVLASEVPLTPAAPAPAPP